MAKVDIGALNAYSNGDVMMAEDYNLERDMLATAINDTDSRVDDLVVDVTELEPQVTDLTTSVSGLDARLDVLEVNTMTYLTLGFGMATYGAETPRVNVDGNTVRLIGKLRNSASAVGTLIASEAVLATLPVGITVAQDRFFPVVTGTAATTGNQLGSVYVKASTREIRALSGCLSGFVALDSISFKKGI